jgi:predicted alpha/beta hydrolase family esterase
MSKRLIVVPRWAGVPESDWYPWLERELETATPKPFDSVIVADMPDPREPTIAAWVQHVHALLGDDPAEIADTMFVAHSVGCQAVLRALAELPDGVHVHGVMCVAGWFWTDSPWASLKLWIDTPFDVERAKGASGRVVVLMSDNDPHTSDWRANTAAWQDKLNASAVLVPGVAHFNGSQYPIILQTLLDRFVP